MKATTKPGMIDLRKLFYSSDLGFSILGSPGAAASKLVPYFKNKKNGFFIEAGANNGFRQSNTLYLEVILGWHGLLIEPNPHEFSNLQTHRSQNICYQCALVSNDYNKPEIRGYFNETEYESSLMGLVSEEDNPRINIGGTKKRFAEREEISVPARTLSSILDEHAIIEVDFLSLDVEGYEILALNGIDFNRHQPKLILIEAWGFPALMATRNVLEPQGYSLIASITQSDHLFKKI
jgi:FkbM family methyltransferase